MNFTSILSYGLDKCIDNSREYTEVCQLYPNMT